MDNFEYMHSRTCLDKTITRNLISKVCKKYFHKSRYCSFSGFFLDHVCTSRQPLEKILSETFRQPAHILHMIKHNVSFKITLKEQHIICFHYSHISMYHLYTMILPVAPKKNRVCHYFKFQYSIFWSRVYSF